tara:strand:+ start:31 stop:567 length:537 start_codon:yes stop_codon:yes gene_type:complete
MSKKESSKEINENLRETLRAEQDKLINAENSPYKRLSPPKGAKLTKTSLTPNMAIALAWIYKFYRYNENAQIGQYYSRKEFFSDLIEAKEESIIKKYTHLKYWGLIEPMPTSPTEIIYKKGYWGITENGIAFCQKEIAMPQFALVYNDFPYEHITNKYVMIDELLAENNLVYDDLIQI